MVNDERKEFLKVKIDLPSFQFELTTADPGIALPELRKILESMQFDEEVLYEEFVMQEMKNALSEGFVGNTQVMGAVKKLLKQEEDYRVSRTEIGATATIDLDQRTRDVRVDRAAVKRAVGNLVQNIDTAAVKHGIVHIQGELSKEDKALIFDHIHKCMPTAQLRAFQSNGAVPTQVSVECIFFGEFPEEDE